MFRAPFAFTDSASPIRVNFDSLHPAQIFVPSLTHHGTLSIAWFNASNSQSLTRLVLISVHDTTDLAEVRPRVVSLIERIGERIQQANTKQRGDVDLVQKHSAHLFGQKACSTYLLPVHQNN
jgi:hypothetical protein